LSTAPASREAQPSAAGPGPSRPSTPTVRRWQREPLVHFLALGLALFAVYALVNRGPVRTPQSHQIVLTLDDLRQLQIGFAAQWQRPPTAQELMGLVESRIRQEVLYREALAMGLDKDDEIVKRRMAQKMEFLAEDVSAAHEPTTEELKAWFAKNSSLFLQPARVSFRHVYFSPDHRRPHTREDAEKTLPRLAGRSAEWAGAAALGDPFMFQDYLADRTADQIAKDFGPPFAKALFAQKPGLWTGPIESGYGWHLVFIDSLTPERASSFEEVEPDVKTAWLAAQKAEAWDKAYKAMRAKYEVLLPGPPADEPTSPAGTTKSPAPAVVPQ
jgi:peptidyl-prolyl cis-trans isomerase C